MMQVDGVPLSTVMRTLEPGAMTAPAAGNWLRTRPGSRLAFCVVTLLVSPAAVIAWAAAASVSERRSGTVAPVIVHAKVVVFPGVATASVGVTETVNVPALVGVPEICGPFAYRPGGS